MHFLKRLNCNFTNYYSYLRRLKVQNFCDSKCIMQPTKKGLVLGCYRDDSGCPVLTPTACNFDQRMQGKLTALIRSLDPQTFNPAEGFCFHNIEDEFATIAIVGLGSKEAELNHLEVLDESRENVRLAAGWGAQCLLKNDCTHIYVENLGRSEEAAEGAAVAAWRYQNLRNPKRLPGSTLELFGDNDHESWQRGLFKAEAQNVARRFCEIPSNHLTPTKFAEEVTNLLCPCGIGVDVRDQTWISDHKLNSLLTVAKGSCEPPVLLEITYCAAEPPEKPIILVGNSVTSRSGGLCVKSFGNTGKLYNSSNSISGAATVVAVIRAASMLSLPLNLIGYLPVYEYITSSGTAVKAGDSIFGRNGKWVEIEDPRNEDRVVIADMIAHAVSEKHPRLVIDVAPMTPGARSLIDTAATICFTTSETIWKEIRKAGIISGDRVWRLPLWNFYRKQVEGLHTYDLNNCGKPNKKLAEPCLAAAFLDNSTTDCTDWLHLDTFGSSSSTKQEFIYPYMTDKLATGRPVRALIQFLYQLGCPNACDASDVSKK